MTSKDWDEILRVLQKELRKAGRADIANIDHYGLERDEVSGRDDSKKLAQKMFIALHTELRTRSPEFLNYTLKKIDKVVENDGPSSVVVDVFDPKSDPNASAETVKDIPLEDKGVTDAIKRIEKAYFEIFEQEMLGAIK